MKKDLKKYKKHTKYSLTLNEKEKYDSNYDYFFNGQQKTGQAYTRKEEPKYDPPKPDPEKVRQEKEAREKREKERAEKERIANIKKKR